MPGLLRLHVWSDGQRSQYKGEKNFGRMSAWPKSLHVGGMELEIHHYMYESHHASGPQVTIVLRVRSCAIVLINRRSPLPQDNAGKDPRRAMDAAILHEKAATIYDYHRCMEWTTKNMARPSVEHAHDGTWGCNGEYFWRAFSNGRDPHAAKYPNISDKLREWHAIKGSNTLYCFRAGPGINDPLVNELQCSFVPCFCAECRDQNHIDCDNLEFTTVWYEVMTEKEQRARMKTRARARGALAAAAAAAAAAPAAAAAAAVVATVVLVVALELAAADAPVAPSMGSAGWTPRCTRSNRILPLAA